MACWREACGRICFCNECNLLHVPSELESTQAISQTAPTKHLSNQTDGDVSDGEHSALVVIGLGNPGEQYMGTPHNVGHCVVDILAQRLNGSWRRQGDLAVVAHTQWQGRQICLMKLSALMNHAGPTLLPLAHELGFRVTDCICVHDDLDLPIGTIRARQRGSDGGHRGVQSIIQAFQDDKFRRVKIGIGKPNGSQSVIDYVLTPFPSEQRVAIDAGNEVAADRVMNLIRQASVSKAAPLRQEPT